MLLYGPAMDMTPGDWQLRAVALVEAVLRGGDLHELTGAAIDIAVLLDDFTEDQLVQAIVSVLALIREWTSHIEPDDVRDFLDDQRAVGVAVKLAEG